MRTRTTLIAGVLLLGAVLVIRAEVASTVRVDGDSMSPTLARRQIAVVRKVATSPAHGDLVILISPADGDFTLKRVVGLPGDVVEIRDAFLYVNNDPVDEPYIDHDAIDAVYYGPVTVPAREILVLGDNRANSLDSRDYGTVPLDAVSGRVVLRLWPPGTLPG